MQASGTAASLRAYRAVGSSGPVLKTLYQSFLTSGALLSLTHSVPGTPTRALQGLDSIEEEDDDDLDALEPIDDL